MMAAETFGIYLIPDRCMPKDRVIGLIRDVDSRPWPRDLDIWPISIMSVGWPWRIALKGEKPQALVAHPDVIERLREKLDAMM